MKASFLTRASVLLFVMCCLGSCTINRPVFVIPPDSAIISNGQTNKIPFRACLFISTAVKNLAIPLYSPIPNDADGDLFLGKAIESNSNALLNNIFENVRQIDILAMHSDDVAQECDVCVSPQISKLENDWTYVQLDISWNITSPDGRQVYASIIKGSRIEHGTRMLKATRHEGKRESLALALKENFQKAQQDLYSNEWWRNPWWIKKDTSPEVTRPKGRKSP
jgi:hypothetical protein